MNISRQLGIRLLVSGAFGLCLALLTIFLTIGSVGGQVVGYQQSHTRRNLEKGDRFIADYYKKNGVYPPSLEAAGLGFWPDGWGRQFLYSLSQGKPLVESLGRDGVRGGVGFDADLSNIHPRPPESAIPFLQAVTDPNVQEMNIVALVCGALSGIIIFRALGSDASKPLSWRSHGVALFVAFGVALFGAMMITAAHVPSGH